SATLQIGQRDIGFLIHFWCIRFTATTAIPAGLRTRRFGRGLAPRGVRLDGRCFAGFASDVIAPGFALAGPSRPSWLTAGGTSLSRHCRLGLCRSCFSYRTFRSILTCLLPGVTAATPERRTQLAARATWLPSPALPLTAVCGNCRRLGYIDDRGRRIGGISHFLSDTP